MIIEIADVRWEGNCAYVGKVKIAEISIHGSDCFAYTCFWLVNAGSWGCRGGMKIEDVKARVEKSWLAHLELLAHLERLQGRDPESR